MINDNNIYNMNMVDQIKLKTISLSYDDNFVRYRLVKSSSHNNSFNWLFLPGGPGADSSYYLSLIDHIDHCGNFWLIDFPANGDNIQNGILENYDFNNWERAHIRHARIFEGIRWAVLGSNQRPID